MSGLWVILPPWIYASVVTLLGRWGEARWAVPRPGQPTDRPPERVVDHLGSAILVNLVFLSLLPTVMLTLTHSMLPFQGARAGVALGLVGFLLGCAPTRLLDVGRRGWDRTLWCLFIDLLRVGGALFLVGWLVTR